MMVYGFDALLIDLCKGLTIIFFIGWSVARLIANLVKRILLSRNINDPLQYFIITRITVASATHRYYATKRIAS